MNDLSVTIKLRKEVMKFKGDDGSEVNSAGIRIILGPKVEKFITMQNFTTGQSGNLELLGYTNPNLVQWFLNSSAGAELLLCEKRDATHSELKKIYIKDENEL